MLCHAMLCYAMLCYVMLYAMCQVCLVVFFAMPFLFYGSILAGERTAMLAKSLPALVTSMLGREHGKQLMQPSPYYVLRPWRPHAGMASC